VRNPTLTRDEFVEMLARRFGLSAEAMTSKTALLEELERTLLEGRTKGQVTALVVDEAQSLSVELLEEIRLLANCETATEKLLPVVLAGQPELRDRLNETALRQLKQRVTLRCELRPFTLVETSEYIANRVRIASGNPGDTFTKEAVIMIHDRSGGIPRTINVICDNALLTGFALGRRPVDRATVTEVTGDLHLGSREPVEPAKVERIDEPKLNLRDTPAPGLVEDLPAQDDQPAPEPRRRLFSAFRGR
jgi:general secretion pathway protein A